MKSHRHIFVWSCIFCCFLTVYAWAQSSPPPAPEKGEAAPAYPGPSPESGAGPSQVQTGPPPISQEGAPPSAPIGEIFFAAVTVSPDSNHLYVILDRFLLKYKLPQLELVKKVELPLISAPVSPSISVSPGEKYIYVVQNGVIYQIDGKTLQIKKSEKIDIQAE